MHRFLQFIPFRFHIHKLLLLSPVLKWGLVCFEQQHIKGDMNVNIVYNGRTYQVPAHYVLNTDGLLSVTFDQNDPDYIRLEESTNVNEKK